MNWNSPKLLAGFFIGIGLLLLVIFLNDLIGKGKFNSSAFLFGLVMFFFAYRAKENKQNK